MDTLSLARASLDLPNHKLPTICRYLGITLDRAHRADADSYATGMLYLDLIKRKKIAIREFAEIGTVKIDTPARPQITTRPPKLTKGELGYMANLIAQLPGSQLPCDSQAEASYVAALERVLNDGKLSKAEAQSLADLAGPLGLRGPKITELNQSFLEAAYMAAASDAIITKEEFKLLSKLAAELGRPNFFAGVQVTNHPADQISQGAPAKVRRRCGHCQEEGHTRRACPVLTGIA